jgi:uncharacterized CHY-type Zn-finger protein
MAKADKVICPKCGKNSWLATTQGMMCKECKYILAKFAPELKTVQHK